jgi:hypothetical protein
MRMNAQTNVTYTPAQLAAAFQFNPNPRIQVLQPVPELVVVVVDDALLEPHRLRQFAIDEAARFQPAPFNAFPGNQFPFVDDLSARLNDFFIQQVRGFLAPSMGIRKAVRMWSRLSMVSLPPEKLQPMQSICHRDTSELEANQCMAASVLYLFYDERLGGTCFFRPKQSAEDTALLVHDSSTLNAAEFEAKRGVAPGYHAASNAYFDLIGSVPPKFNRMIFYDGGIFHSGHITQPELLTSDPATGRLTLNGFFVFTKRAD